MRYQHYEVSELKRVWNAFDIGMTRQEVADLFNKELSEIDNIQTQAIRKYGRPMKWLREANNSAELCVKKIERPKAEYSNKNFSDTF